MCVCVCVRGLSVATIHGLSISGITFTGTDTALASVKTMRFQI